MQSEKILKRNRYNTIRADKAYSPEKGRRIAEEVVKGEYLLRDILRKEGIASSTYYKWQRDYPEFKAMIEEAKRDFRNYIGDSAVPLLRQQMEGYKVKNSKKKHIYINPTPEQEAKGVKRRKILIEESNETKEIQPNLQAIIFALTSCDPQNWQNRTSTELTGAGGAPLIPEQPLSREAYASLLDQLKGVKTEEHED